MRILLNQLRVSCTACLVLLVLTAGLYPLAIWAIAQAAFSDQASGSLVTVSGKTVGSSLIGQKFFSPRYFHPRPSAAGDGYDGAASSGSNAGPLNAKWLATVTERVKSYRLANGLHETQLVPADAVTASGSGLDPHISRDNARLQIPRIARERGVAAERLQVLVDLHTEGPDLGVLGESGVNVLLLNIALDREQRE